MIDILTSTLGRELYINRLIDSIELLGSNNLPPAEFQHHIVFQGAKPSKQLERKMTFYGIIFHHRDEVKSIGALLNEFIPQMEGNLFLKLDDDAQISSPDFFRRILNISELVPNGSFSPFPVGLINNLGGVPANRREVKYCEKDDTYYTLRYTSHIGGFCRVTPREIIRNVKFNENGHSEDGEYSQYCNSHGFPLFYLENDLIVCHQESSLGQHERYGEAYFKGRF